ncbi:hypothetical protein N9195_02350 [bacterium]|nr:hypothetical protein [bacterium]MDB4438409.1 hypothetical protein [bacterium]
MKKKIRRQIVLATALAAIAGSIQAESISGTGFSADAIAEKEGATPDEVTDYDGLARWVFVEAGSPSINTTTATVTVPDSADRTFTTDFGTEFELQAYDQSNVLLNGDTFSLTTPANYSDLKFLIFGIGGNTADNFQATVNFSDASSTVLVFSISDWQGSRDYNATERVAIARRGAGSWASYFGPGVFPRELNFELAPEDQAKVIQSIEFTLTDRLAVAAVNGTSLTPRGPFVITDIEYARDAEPNPTVTLTWPKTGAASYVVKYSPDLIDWDADLDDGVTDESDENPEDADQITVTFPLVGDPEDAPVLFFRIEEG